MDFNWTESGVNVGQNWTKSELHLRKSVMDKNARGLSCFTLVIYIFLLMSSKVSPISAQFQFSSSPALFRIQHIFFTVLVNLLTNYNSGVVWFQSTFSLLSVQFLFSSSSIFPHFQTTFSSVLVQFQLRFNPGLVHFQSSSNPILIQF